MKKVRRISEVVSFAACAAAVIVTPVASHAAGKAPATTVRASNDYILGADDVIDIAVRNHDELNRTVTIRPDGKISLPRLNGQVQAAGKTPVMLAAAIQNELAKVINHGEVTVSVKEVHSRRARILGAVKTAGTYELKEGWRLMDLVAVSGGLTTKPVRVSGRIVRSGKLVIPLDVEKAFGNPGGSANVALRTDDLVVLEAQDISKQIHVLGEVKAPGAFDLEEGLTPVSLLAEAGGATEKAALRGVYVSRGATQIPLDMQAVLVEGTNDPKVASFQFWPGDVLMVPENQLKFGIYGELLKPGNYPYPESKDAATALRTLALAGGQTPEADLRKATISRVVDGKPTTIAVDLDAIIKGTSPDNVTLLPDDILYIPEGRDQVTVSGKVGKPGVYDLKDGMTLAALLAQAGSQQEGASLSRAYISREGKQIPVDLYAAITKGTPDEIVANFKLQPNDNLVIPDTTNQLSVIGQVAKTGAYNLADGITIASLLGQAGGTTTEAALSKSFVVRGEKQIPLNLSPTLEGAMSPAMVSFKFQPGDALVIPTTQVRYAVMGNVRQPGSFAYPEDKRQATLLNALTTAGGQLPDSDMKNAVLVHTSTNTSEQIDFNNLMRNGGVNRTLQPGDVLYIADKKPKPAFNIASLLGPLAVLFR